MSLNRNKANAKRDESSRKLTHPFSDSSFLTSLGDDELISLVEKLSQERKKKQLEFGGSFNKDTAEKSSEGFVKHVGNDFNERSDIAPSTMPTIRPRKQSQEKILEDLSFSTFENSSAQIQSSLRQESPEFIGGDTGIKRNIPSSPIRRRDTLASLHDNDILSQNHFGYNRMRSFSNEGNNEGTENSDQIEMFFHQLENNRLSDDTDEEEIGPLHQFGDYETYFHNKQLKQQKADAKTIEWEKERLQVCRDSSKDSSVIKNIFENCIIHVNGHTIPDINEIHRLVILHGGKFLHYLGAKGNATHIICSSLTPKKKLAFARYKVVKPEWIVDSVKADKLLSWLDYALINNDYGQMKINLRREENLAFGKMENDDWDGNEVVMASDDEFSMTPLTQEAKNVLENGGNPIDIRTIDAKHPNFLANFFSRSRLHHLSTWKSDLRLSFLQKVISTVKKTKPSNSLPHTVIIHVDFDCFFVAVSALSRPELDINNHPLCVSHGGSSADVASCNYASRKFGVYNGMWLGNAKKKCPNLLVLDYNFAEYERISGLFYDILISLGADSVFPVSVDEALLDISTLCCQNMENQNGFKAQVIEICQEIKDRIFEATRCSASIGASKNVLLAKLALRKAKPNGIFYHDDESDIDKFLADFPINNLPGTGKAIQAKLEKEFAFKIVTIGNLKSLKMDFLINLFGIKTGTKLFEYSRGIDDTNIDISKNPEKFLRKSVSVDVNWGIRFDSVEQVDDFLWRLSCELHQRLVKISMSGSSITLRLAKRATAAPVEPPKFMGMGLCDFVSKSSRLGLPTNDSGYISSELKSLYRMISVDPKELRGIAVTMTKLVDSSTAGISNQTILPFTKIRIEEKLIPNPPNSSDLQLHPSRNALEVSQYVIPSEVDSSVLEELPSQIKNEIKRKRKDILPAEVDISTPIPNCSTQRDGIDWSVFNALPSELKSEIRDELNRRDLVITNEPFTPFKRTNVSSPKKSYLQQVFPVSQEDSPKLIRLHSPTKISQRKRRKIQTPSPSKKGRQSVQLFQYDQSVLEELPSSIRREILQEADHAEEASKVGTTIVKNNLVHRSVLSNKKWFNTQVPLILLPKLQSLTDLSDIKKLLSDWVSSSITSGGPHERDLEIFTTYISDILKLGNSTRCILLYQFLRNVVDCEKMINDNQPCAATGICDWEQSLSKVHSIIKNYGLLHNLTFDVT